MSIIYVVLGILGLGFLVFIHELGHYWMACKVGMRVETFSIGMGSAIVRWYRKGVKWQIGWIPFGGYVKIAGTDKEGNKEPHEIPDGFFGKKPIDRIKVAFMGPLVNIVFALIVFVILWASGGREKPYSDFSSRIGLLDKRSPFLQHDIHEGDQITSYDDYAITKSRDHLYSTMLGGEHVLVKGEKKHYLDPEQEKAFALSLTPYQHPYAQEEGVKTLGILTPASYLYVQGDPKDSLGPIQNSDLREGDRVIWVNGQLVFSPDHLRYLVNQNKIFLTFQRGDQFHSVTVPLYRIEDYNLPRHEQTELADWRHDLNFTQVLGELWFLPYDISPDGVVVEPLSLIDTTQNKAWGLQAQDRIVAVNGDPVSSGRNIFKACQERKISLIVQRGQKFSKGINWLEADKVYEDVLHSKALKDLTNQVGIKTQAHEGDLYLLSPILPKKQQEFALSEEDLSQLKASYAAMEAEIQKMPPGPQKNVSEKLLKQTKEQRLLGLQLQDLKVSYNPPPWVLSKDVMVEMWRTLRAFAQGALNPKWMSGPVGIVHVMHVGWSLGVKEALFWLAVISLNLAILNLLPIPVLDGGNICFSLWEMITKKPLKARTMELLVIPFVVLLITMFLFVTYNDIVRLLGL